MIWKKDDENDHIIGYSLPASLIVLFTDAIVGEYSQREQVDRHPRPYTECSLDTGYC